MGEGPDCLVIGTFSGAMTVGMMGHLLCDMMEAEVLDAIVSTGALMAHGFVQNAGLSHFRYEERMDDNELYEKGYIDPELTRGVDLKFGNAQALVELTWRTAMRSGIGDDIAEGGINFATKYKAPELFMGVRGLAYPPTIQGRSRATVWATPHRTGGAATSELT